MAHIHKYRRVNISKKDKPPSYIMQCSLPHCNHHVEMIDRERCPKLIGKVAVCNRCNDPFELDRIALTKAKPVCSLCTGGSSKQEKLDKANKFFAELEKKIASGE